MNQNVMEADQAQRCAEWLDRLGEWTPDGRRADAVACEVVRGIVEVDSPEYAAAVAWAGGHPDTSAFGLALQLYGPVLTDAERVTRAVFLAHMAQRATAEPLSYAERVNVREAIR